MSIINLEINFFMTREIYVSRQLTHPLHYQSLHTFPHYHTYSYISHQHTVSPSFISLPTVPQYSQISHCFFFYFFSVLTRCTLTVHFDMYSESCMDVKIVHFDMYSESCMDVNTAINNSKSEILQKKLSDCNGHQFFFSKLLTPC